MTKLKPVKCNCGNEELDLFQETNLEGDGTEYVVMCQSCKKVAVGNTQEQAISNWNNKSFIDTAARDKKRQLLEQLKDVRYLFKLLEENIKKLEDIIK